MSTLAYSEPYKFPAGALALVVHAVFFALLYFSFNWHVKIPENMVVEMWDSLPDQVTEIAPPPPPETTLPPPAPVIQKAEKIVTPKAVEPVVESKADIEFKEKKKKIEAAKKEELIKQKQKEIEIQRAKAELAKQQAEQAKQQAALAKQQAIETQKQREEKEARDNERIQERKAKMRAENDVVIQGEVARYTDLIRAKISRNINMPPDVPADAEAIFRVTVLPGGAVMDGVKLEKSSGNAAYDRAAERAIYKAQPLPVPQDAELARVFHELRLSVKP